MNQGEAKTGNNQNPGSDSKLRTVILGGLDWHEPYNTCAFSLSADSRFIFTAGLSNRIGQRDRETGQLVRFFQHKAGAVYSLASSPDGRYLCAGRDDGRIDQWDLMRGERIRFLEGHAREVNTLIFSPDGRYLYSGGSDGAILQWEMSQGERMRQLTAHTDFVMALCVTPDGKTLYSGGMDNQIIHWDLETGRPTIFKEGQPDGVRCLCLAPDGGTLYCGGYAHYLSDWDPAQGSLRRIIEGPRCLAALCFSPDGRYLYGSDDEATYRLDRNGADEMETLCHQGGRSLFYIPEDHALYSGIWRVNLASKDSEEWSHKETYDARAFSPTHDHCSLFIVHRKQVFCESIHRWDLVSGEKERFWKDYDGLAELGSLVISDDDRFLSFCSKRFKTFIRLDMHKSGLPFRKLSGDVDVYCFTPNGSRVYTSKKCLMQNEKPIIKEWNWTTGDLIRQFDGHDGTIRDLIVSADSQYLYSGGEDYSIIQWDLQTGEKVRTMKVQGLVIEQLAVSPDGQYLYSRTMDGIREWHQGEGTLIADCFGTFALSPDGRFIYYQFKGAIMRWDCQERRETRLWDESPGSPRLIAGDKLLYCGRENGSVTIYNIEQGGIRFTFYNLDQGFLFTIPDKTGQTEYFWTDRQDLIGVIEVNTDGNPQRFLMPDEAEASDYIKAHNRKDLVKERIKQVMNISSIPNS